MFADRPFESARDRVLLCREGAKTQPRTLGIPAAPCLVPAGGAVPKTTTSRRQEPDGILTSVRLSELLASAKDSLVIYTNTSFLSLLRVYRHGRVLRSPISCPRNGCLPRWQVPSPTIDFSARSVL